MQTSSVRRTVPKILTNPSKWKEEDMSETPPEPIDSILNEIKLKLNRTPDDTAFDAAIISEINTAFGVLNQLGVGLVVGYQITGAQNVWAEFYTDPRLSGVRTFVYLTVKNVFEPP